MAQGSWSSSWPDTLANGIMRNMGRLRKAQGPFQEAAASFWLMPWTSRVSTRSLSRNSAAAHLHLDISVTDPPCIEEISRTYCHFNQSLQKHVFTSSAMQSSKYIRAARRASRSRVGTHGRGEVKGLGFVKLCLGQYLARVFSVSFAQSHSCG